MVTKTMDIILLGVCCCGGSINHSALSVSPFPILLASFGAEAVNLLHQQSLPTVTQAVGGNLAPFLPPFYFSIRLSTLLGSYH